MAKVASKILWWTLVADAASYNVRALVQGATFDYAVAPIIPGVSTTPAASGDVEVDMHGVTLAEGTYDIYITAVDKAGNESDPLELAGSVLDFTPPSAPSSGGFR